MKQLRALAPALCLLAACGAALGRTASRGKVTRAYAPYTLAADARDPLTAVVLGTGWEPSPAAGAARGPAGEAASGAIVSTLVPLRAAGPRRLRLPGQALAVELEVSAVGAAPGSSSQAQARPAQVDWPLEIAIASAAAARALGKDVGEYHWRAQSFGPAGRPPAGLATTAMLAAGFVAALTGAPIKAEVTILGVVLPDGSVAPDARMAAALAAALAAGQRRLVLPASLAPSAAASAPPQEELFARARARGAVVTTAATLAEAYAALTGESLPVSAPAPAAALELAPPVQAELAAVYLRRQAALATNWAALLLLDNAARVPAKVRMLADAAQRTARLAESLHRAAQDSAALGLMAEAQALTAAVVQIRTVVDLVQLGHVDEALDMLDEHVTADAEAVAAMRTLGATQPASGDAALDVLAAWQVASEAFAVGQEQRKELAELAAALGDLRGGELAELGSAATATRVADAVAILVLSASQQRARLALAMELVGIAGPSGPARPAAPSEPTGPAERAQLVDGAGARPSVELWTAARAAPSVAELWRRMPDAEPRPGRAPPGADLGQRRLTELGWIIAAAELPDSASNEPPSPRRELAELLARWGRDSAPRAMRHWALAQARTAAAWQRWSERALLAADRSVLPHLVRTADLQARAAAQAARVAIGVVPRSLQLAYQRGRALAAAEDPALRRAALVELWRACALGDAAVSLARAATPRDAGP
ncbi:MAG: hypothetical protein IPI49_04125 [Myxococcales bacterium]|nr:hypothetical protein [Myxococcales bacterium]